MLSLRLWFAVSGIILRGCFYTEIPSGAHGMGVEKYDTRAEHVVKIIKRASSPVSSMKRGRHLRTSKIGEQALFIFKNYTVALDKRSSVYGSRLNLCLTLTENVQ